MCASRAGAAWSVCVREGIVVVGGCVRGGGGGEG